ncbi:MAG TPA: hypothetical protein VGK28_01735 [Candidatus Dormibacteraeota bacterium]|jgi:hypothetical protein
MDWTERLTRVGGLAFPVLASAGAADRAAAIGARVERAHEWLADLLSFRPRVRMLALASDDWERLPEKRVFGFPHFIGDDTIVVGGVPARFFGQIVEFLRPDLSEATLADFEAVYGSPPNVNAFADLLALHELGHLFHVQAGFWTAGEWLPELFCNVALEGYVTEMEPSHLDVLETLPLATTEVRPERFTVQELDRMQDAGKLGGAINYAWFELLLHAAAKPIWEEGGAGALRRLYERFRDGPPADDIRTVLYDEVHPVFGRVLDAWPASIARPG